MHRTLTTCTATIKILHLLKGDDSSETGRQILSRKGRSSLFGTASKKIGALIHPMKFLSPEVALYLHKSTIYAHVWNTVVTSGLVTQLLHWIC